MSESNFTQRRGGRNVKDMSGRRFGRLTVVGLHSVEHRVGARWVCVCDCGNSSAPLGAHLRSGNTTSCGCAQREAVAAAATVHGLARSPEYSSWENMWRRCTNPKHKCYSLYRGRTPPERWRSFESFYSDVGPMPGPGYTLERIDNNKPYGPGNCKWATQAEQSANTARTIRVRVVDSGTGPTSLADACRVLGLSYPKVRHRLRRHPGRGARWASDGLLDLA